MWQPAKHFSGASNTGGKVYCCVPGEQVVPASELAAAMKQIKALQRLLNKTPDVSWLWKLGFRLFARNVPFKPRWIVVKPVQTHGKRTSTPDGFDKTPVTGGTKNDESVRNDDKQLADQRSRRKMSGSVASIGDRADFRTSAGIATRFMLLLIVIPQFAAASTAPDFTFCTSGCCAPV